MTISSIIPWLSYENLENLVNNYESLGLFVAFLLPLLDSFFGLIPIWAIVTINISVFGFWPALFVSWLGSVTGATILFFIIRKLGIERVSRFIRRYKRGNVALGWIDRANFSTILILFCFPFTPTFLINIFAALSKVNTKQYLLGMIFGKSIMMFTVGLIGYDIKSYVHSPLKVVLLIIFIILLWYGGKAFEKRLVTPK